jgi:hypothetical protein
MTIKHLGGIFGRNPTFNDVTIEGQLTFDGDIDVNSDLKVAGDIETTGNVIIATSGNGIDFSATAGTGTSELFDDYEEGTWTPTVAGDATGVISSGEGYYTKIGRLVYGFGIVNVGTNFTSNLIGGLPFSVTFLASLSTYAQGLPCFLGAADTVVASPKQGTSNIAMFNDFSVWSTHAPIVGNSSYRFNFMYQV